MRSQQLRGRVTAGGAQLTPASADSRARATQPHLATAILRAPHVNSTAPTVLRRRVPRRVFRGRRLHLPLRAAARAKAVAEPSLRRPRAGTGRLPGPARGAHLRSDIGHPSCQLCGPPQPCAAAGPVVETSARAGGPAAAPTPPLAPPARVQVSPPIRAGTCPGLDPETDPGPAQVDCVSRFTPAALNR